MESGPETMPNRRGLKFPVQRTSQCVKRTSGARVMTCPRNFVFFHKRKALLDMPGAAAPRPPFQKIKKIDFLISQPFLMSKQCYFAGIWL